MRSSCGWPHPMLGWNRTAYSVDGRLPSITGLALANQVGLLINGPEVAEILLTEQIKFFERHPYTRNALKLIVGDGMMTSEAD